MPDPDPCFHERTSSRQFILSFSDDIRILTYAFDCSVDQPPLISVQQTHTKQRNRTEAKICESQSRWDRKSPSSSRRMAVARALSLAMLLGLPARITFDTSLGRLIADTGCGKDMVSNTTFSEDFMARRCYKRENLICMQTANGPVELDSEISFWLKKLKQKVNAVVGGDTPDLLSVGYRCQELGFGFHWEPRSVSYFALPDGTEVDLHVDHYVPYLFDDGDVTIHRAACSYEIPSVGSDFLPSPEPLHCRDAHIETPAFDIQYYDISDNTPVCCPTVSII